MKIKQCTECKFYYDCEIRIKFNIEEIVDNRVTPYCNLFEQKDD